MKPVHNPQRRACLAAALLLIPVPGLTTPAFVIEQGGLAEPPRSPAQAQVMQNFADAYVRAGRPRIALWWNRALSDRHTDGSRHVDRVTAALSADRRHASVEASSGRVARPEPLRSARLAERDLFQVETEFTRGLLDAGVRVIDRATMLRLTAAHQSGPADLDRQQLEIQALIGHADYFLEILLSPDDDAPLGLGFRTDLKTVQGGQVLGSAYLTAMPDLPPPGRGHYVARPGGYELVAPSPARITVRAIGDALAMQTMQELARRLPMADAPGSPGRR